MHLLVGSSLDATADLIVECLGDNVVRINNDRPHDLAYTIGSDGFVVSDPYGREVNQSNLRTVILRKTVPVDIGEGGEELYARREHTRAIDGLLDWIERLMPSAMPMSHRVMSRCTKFVCSRVAYDYFQVPQWVFTSVPSGCLLARPVVKNLCGLPIEKVGPDGLGALLYVQEVQPSQLADGWPWYLQEKVESRFDLTVLYLGGECHALRLDRSSFSGLDWRRFIAAGIDDKWEHVMVPEHLRLKITAYMKDLGLSYGRLDFLYSEEDFSDIQFLEVNPHGQWAWMDLDKSRGIFDSMMRFLTTPKPTCI